MVPKTLLEVTCEGDTLVEHPVFGKESLGDTLVSLLMNCALGRRLVDHFVSEKLPCGFFVCKTRDLVLGKGVGNR